MKNITEIALSQYGVTEFEANEHNPKIIDYSKECGFDGIITDETAWCSIFMNWCALKAGVQRSGKLNARSWLKTGSECKSPKTGDVVVFWRESRSSWKGHVAIYISKSECGSYIYCLGGNQNNQVNIRPYLVSRVLGFRELDEV